MARLSANLDALHDRGRLAVLGRPRAAADLERGDDAAPSLGRQLLAGDLGGADPTVWGDRVADLECDWDSIVVETRDPLVAQELAKLTEDL